MAAATTSLPEALGGQPELGLPLLLAARRHPDPRVADAGRLLHRGHGAGATGCCGPWPATSSKLQIMYGPAGERRLDEWEADLAARLRELGAGPHRERRLGAVPARRLRRGHVGPLLVGQGRAECQSRAAWGLQTQLVEFIEKGWRQPDDGIWEVRGPRRHFTHSKVMAWVAVDRAVRTLEEWPELKGPLEKWRDAAQRHLHRGLREGVQRGRRRVHPVLRVRPARRERAHDPARRLPAAE